MNCLVKKLRPDAKIPEKAHISDTGYDLWILDEHKKLDNGVVMYSTGISLQPAYGTYFEIVPRSSIIKTGYIQANGIGVIDQSYRGELFVPLVKIDEDAPDLELPKKIAQLVVRKVNTCDFVEVEELTDTIRGAGGFGSTDRVGFKPEAFHVTSSSSEGSDE